MASKTVTKKNYATKFHQKYNFFHFLFKNFKTFEKNQPFDLKTEFSQIMNLMVPPDGAEVPRTIQNKSEQKVNIVQIFE